MTRRGAWARRRLVARALGLEQCEERWLPSAIGLASAPPSEGPTVAVPQVPALVSLISAATPGSRLDAYDISPFIPGAGGIASGLAGPTTITAPGSLLDRLVLPLVGTAKTVRPSGSMAMDTGFVDALNLANEGPMRVPAASLTTTSTVAANDFESNASGVQAGPGSMNADIAAGGEIVSKAELAPTSGANDAQPGVFPGVSFVATSIPGLAAAASLAGSSGAIVTVGQVGGFSLVNDSSGVAVAVSPPPAPLLPLSVAQQLTLGFSGQVSIAWSVVGGNVLAVDGERHDDRGVSQSSLYRD